MNKLLFRICLIIILVCLIGSLLLFYALALDEPVFLEHYYELLAYDDRYIELSYITNADDDSKLYGVEFPQLEGSGVFVNYFEMASSSAERFSRYKLQTIRVRILRESDEYFDDIVLDNVIIKLSDGKTVTGNIGKIVLFADRRGESTKLVETLVSSSSNMCISFSDARFLDDVSVVSLPYALKDETAWVLKLYANKLPADLSPESLTKRMATASSAVTDGYDLAAFNTESILLTDANLPIEFKKDDYVQLIGDITIAEGDTRKYNRYDINRRVYYENTEGETDYSVLYNMNYQPYFEAADFREFLKHKGII